MTADPVPTAPELGRPLVVAHRGASAAEPENTLAAFRAAVAMGADAVELDARRTADGAVVVHHDAVLADQRAIVDVARADLPAHVCSLEDALDACGPLIVNVEIKNWPGDPDFDAEERVAGQVAEALARRGRPERWQVSSFHKPTIDRIKVLAPELVTGFLHVHIDGMTALGMALEGGHDAINPWDPLVDADLVRAAHAEGIAVNVWTVDDPERMRRLAEWGVDGIITNVPDVARRALGLVTGH